MTARQIDVRAFKEWLEARVNPEDVWRDYFPQWREGKPVVCPFHDDNAASLSLSANGKGLCHACAWKCSWPGGFVADYLKKPLPVALRTMRLRYVADTVPSRDWLTPHVALCKASDVLGELRRVRGITKAVVLERKLGWKANRLTIPVFDAWGCCVNLRAHDALRQAGGDKTTSYKAGFGEARLYPDDVVTDSGKVYLLEGEPDTLCALSQGLPAACQTGGANTWKDAWNERFRGKKVVICYDLDDAGRAGSSKVASKLEGVAEWVKILELPVKDFTDHIVGGGTVQDVLTLEEKALARKRSDGGDEASSTDPGKGPVVDLSLADTEHPTSIDRIVRTRALVAGMDTEKHGVPRRITVKCNEYARHKAAGQIPPKCHQCWMPDSGLEGERTVDADNRELLKAVGASDGEVRDLCRRLLKVPAKCDTEIKVPDKWMASHVALVPDIPQARRSEEHRYVNREAFCFDDVVANKRYLLEGRSVLHPKTQRNVLVVSDATPVVAEIDAFKLDGDIAPHMGRIFHTTDPYGKMMEMYDGFAARVTKIVGRPLLHAAIDLVFHSPLSFRFNREEVRHGYLETMVIGDTRCGKGFVAEGLARYYGLGEVVSGENASVAGLLGGLESFGRKLVLRWGAVPLNDRGLVIVDEAGNLVEVVPRLSRVRSEGIAEITKIGHNFKTASRTRLIWLCNPTWGTMADFVFGVNAIPTVMEKAEDMARLDYAFAVASSDVDGRAINVIRNGAAAKEPPRKDLSRMLVQWVWSRRPEQVRFTKEAIHRILEVHARDFAAKYHPSVPLVQAQNIRIKLAKVAAAVAGRVFSHAKDDTEILEVRRVHADAAAKVLTDMYAAPAMAYDTFSQKQQGAEALARPEDLDKMMQELGEQRGKDLVRCLLTRRLTVRTLSAAAGMDRMETEQVVLDTLLRCNALKERTNYFTIAPAFKRWLEEQERKT